MQTREDRGHDSCHRGQTGQSALCRDAAPRTRASVAGGFRRRGSAEDRSRRKTRLGDHRHTDLGYGRLSVRPQPAPRAGLVQPRVVFRAAPHTSRPKPRPWRAPFGAFFVAKPVNPENLLAVVEAALSGPKSTSGGTAFRASIHRLVSCARSPGSSTGTRRISKGERQLDRGIAERDAQLEVVRAALDQEIKKRLWAEQELTQSNLRLQDQVVHDGLTGLP